MIYALSNPPGTGTGYRTTLQVDDRPSYLKHPAQLVNTPIGRMHAANLALASRALEETRLGDGRLDAILLGERFRGPYAAALDSATTRERNSAVAPRVRRQMGTVERTLAAARGRKASRAAWLDANERASRGGKPVDVESLA